MSSDNSELIQKECYNQYCPNTCDLELLPFSNSKILFCNICADLYKKRKCCYFCAQVYRDDEQNFLDGKNWVQCDNIRCGKWTHIECEEQGIERQLNNKSFKYKCPWCRIQKQSLPPKRKKMVEQMHAHDISDFDPDYINPNTKKYNVQVGFMSFYEPIIKKNTFLEELLKKYGEFTQCINQDDLQNDLIRMRSLVQ